MYNETDGQAIYPTPMIGMVGLIEDIDQITTQDFKQVGDLVYVIGETGDDFSGSELQKMQVGDLSGALNFDLATEAAHQTLVQQAIKRGLLNSAHDLSEGGLGVALAESLFGQTLGLTGTTTLLNRQLFAETQSRFVVSVAPANQAAFEQLAGKQATRLGTTTSQPELNIQTADGQLVADVAALKATYGGALDCLMK